MTDNLVPASCKARIESATGIEILKSLQKLKVLGSVLYIAAHPDDENTALLAYMSQGRLMRTGYLSLTRGDGGQNLLGSEKDRFLGVLRTQELLSARRIDGAKQFFSRAIDFGYSKRVDETLHKWDRNQVLADIVRIIRYFRPDIIITRFSENQGRHGHHLASAILAREAFSKAADAECFPEQLNELTPWQAKRLLWNTWSPNEQSVVIDVGQFDPLLGKSYAELAAISRSMHKSQGFGVSPDRGRQINYFNLIAGDSANEDLFEGINSGWERVTAGQEIKNKIDQVIISYDPSAPAKSVPDLIELYRLFEHREKSYWIRIKQKETKDLIRQCTGLWLESIVRQPSVNPGGSVNIRSLIINRSDIPIIVKKIDHEYSVKDTLLNVELKSNQPYSYNFKVRIPSESEYTNPYWLQLPPNGAMFQLADPQDIYLAQTKPALISHFKIYIDDLPLTFEIPVQFRRTDAVKGEQLRPFVIQPPLGVSILQPNYIFIDQKEKRIEVSVQSVQPNLGGELILSVPENWKVSPSSIPFKLKAAGEQTSFPFLVRPEPGAEDGLARLSAHIEGKYFQDEMVKIEYDHITPQVVLKRAQARLINLHMIFKPERIGYIMGSGDEIPQALGQLGYQVDLLSDIQLAEEDLSVYHTIISGVRAFNTRIELGRLQKRLLGYVRGGGTWIVQHNTRFGIQVEQIGPYPFRVSGRDRIAEEDAALEILIPDHQIFNYPNKITTDDFKGWIQERGLYFAESWGGKLYPLLAGHDKNEPSKLGGLLYAPYGNGVFIYTAYSWFRQLPAGVPGAYRLFVNLISARGQTND